MNQDDNRFLDDIARLMAGAAGAAQGVREEIDVLLNNQVERLVARMNLVSREEFEAVARMAALAREENERLSERLAQLEERLGSGAPETENR